jgi:hypothetical protein
MATSAILQKNRLDIPCLLLKLRKYADCITKYTRVMIISTGEPPQYIVVPATDIEMKDMI